MDRLAEKQGDAFATRHLYRIAWESDAIFPYSPSCSHRFGAQRLTCGRTMESSR
jgi:hypothetical protein